MSQIWNSWPKWTKAALLAVPAVILLLIIAGLIVVSQIFRVSHGTLTTIETIEEGIGVSLPKETRVLGGSYDFGPTVIHVVAKVAISKTTAATFFRNAGFEPFTQNEHLMPPMFADEMKRQGWSVGASQKAFYTVKQSADQDMTANVYCALDMSDSQTALVYIYCWH